MKIAAYLATLCLVLSCSQISAQNSTGNPGQSSIVEMSFAFNRQSGFSSNQYAVWIENSQGSLVKTLFATKFTADGGWQKRPESIPLWVSKSGLAGLSKKDIDAFSGATPKTGSLSYGWDGKDRNGNAAPDGEYVFCLEATLRGENRVLYKASFQLKTGQAAPVQEAEVKLQYFGSSTKERGMIENVKITFR